MTKALPSSQHWKFTKLMGMCSLGEVRNTQPPIEAINFTVEVILPMKQGSRVHVAQPAPVRSNKRKTVPLTLVRGGVSEDTTSNPNKRPKTTSLFNKSSPQDGAPQVSGLVTSGRNKTGGASRGPQRPKHWLWYGAEISGRSWNKPIVPTNHVLVRNSNNLEWSTP